MASQVCETLAFINGDEGVRGMEVLQINGALLMSLMDESSPSDESDDDRLDSLIRSFEAEISGSKMEDHDSASMGLELMMNMEEGTTQSWNMGESDGQEYYWGSSSEIGVEWVDMDVMPSSPFEDRSWCIATCGDERDGFSMGEHGYNAFWQDMACN